MNIADVLITILIPFLCPFIVKFVNWLYSRN